MRKHIDNVSRRHGLPVAVAAALTGLAGIATTPVHADYVIDVRAFEVNGQPLGGSNTPKDLLIAPGDVVGLELWGQVSGVNGVHDETTKGGAGNIVSSNGGLQGDLAASPYGGFEPFPTFKVGNFAALGSQNGAIQDLDGDGDLDVGTPMSDQVATAFFRARSNARENPSTYANNGFPNARNLDANSAEILIGHATFTADVNATGETLVNFVNAVEPDGSPATEGAVWEQDGTNFNPVVPGAVYTAGPPVRLVVPEPAFLPLAWLAGAALLARHRRRSREAAAR